MTSAGVDDRTAHLARSLRAAVDGPAWHGPALGELLARFGAREVLVHPFDGARSAWELVGHVALWAEVAAERLHGRALAYPGEDVDWAPPPATITAAGWRRLVERARAAHLLLAEATASLPAIRLGELVPGQDYDVETMLRGVAEHTAYHGGQLALLRRALDAKGARR